MPVSTDRSLRGCLLLWWAQDTLASRFNVSIARIQVSWVSKRESGGRAEGGSLSFGLKHFFGFHLNTSSGWA